MEPLTQDAALAALERYTADLSAEARAALLLERSVKRGAVTLYDPYSAAIHHLMDPRTVKARTEGSVSETYVDPALVIAYLREQSTALRLSWPPPEPESPVQAPLDLRLTWEPW